MWADVDTNRDFLNYSEVSDLVVQVVRAPSMRPVSVGVFGTWGTGKSTLLNLVERDLDGSGDKSEFIVVRFDAWLYQGFDDARAALMEVIASRLITAAEADPTVLEKAKKLLKRVNKMRALGLLVEGGALAMGVPTFGFAAKGFDALGRLFSGAGNDEDVEAVREAGSKGKERTEGLLEAETHRTPPQEIAAFRAEFEAVLTGLGKTLVVFVDNLDRCLPKQAIQTLEALRLFLFMGHTAFIVAADEEMIRHSVASFFSDPGERHVTDYLDKLIQVPVRVPRLGVQEVRAYLFLLFATASTLLGDDKVESLRAGLEEDLRKSWKNEPISTEAALALLGPEPPDDVVKGFNIAHRIAPVLAGSSQVQGNPRIVKRMLNVVRMRGHVAMRRDMPVDEAMITKLALFERCTDAASVNHLYAQINAAAGGRPEVLATLEGLLEDPQKFSAACPAPWVPKVDFIREWLALPPSLSDTDLRPLVYLSRETIPLRTLRSGLSQAAAESLQVLLRVASSTSRAGQLAMVAIPETECDAVMSGMIESFRRHDDWTERPPGIHGALLLAGHSPDAGKTLGAFLRSVVRGKLPPWLNLLVAGKSWYSGAEES